MRVSGFTGLDFVINYCEQPQHQSLIVIVTSAAPLEEENETLTSPGKPTVSIILHPSTSSSASRQPWIAPLIEAVQASTGCKAVVESFDQAQPDDSKVVLLATDLENGQTLLDTLDEVRFNQLRHILLSSRGALWLTSSGGIRNATVGPAQVQGFLRTLRQGDTIKPYGLMDLPLNWTETAEKGVVDIARVLHRVIHEEPNGAADWEDALDDGALYIPRVYPMAGHSKINTAETKPELVLPFWGPDHSLIWDDLASGFIEKPYRPGKTIPEGIVEIKTKAFSPSYPPKHVNEHAPRVYEVSGVVVGLGNNTQASGLQLGDNVCGIAMGPFASTARAAWTGITRVPDEINLETAACIPLAYATAYHALVDICRLQNDNKVMIVHAVGNPDGEATLTLATQMDAQVWLLVQNGSQSDARQLAEQYQIPREQVFIKPSTKFISETILGQTNGLGIGILVNASSKSPIPRFTTEIIARFGRVADLAGVDSNPLDMKQFSARCATYARIDRMQMAEYNGRSMKQALEASFQILSHKSSPKPNLSGVARYCISELKEALTRSQEQDLKVIVVPEADDQVKVLPPSRSLSLAYHDGTYLIFGGVGGIGEIGRAHV